MKLKDRTAIITGAAKGIGRETAILFAKEGANIVIADMDESFGRKTAQDINDAGGSSIFVKTNVASLKNTEDTMNETINKFGKIDILINNAGITSDSTLLKMTEEQFLKVIDINLKGVFNMTKCAVPYMIKNNYGRIVNTSSIVALYGNFGQTNYIASKAGVIGMTKVWAREFGRKGITVNAVAPGFIATDMLSSVPQNILESIKEKTPVQRLGHPEDIANAYLFLSSEEASFINGITLSVDGGLVW